MPNWVEIGAEAIKQEQARRQQNQEYQEVLRKTLTVNSQNVFGSLLEAVAKAVKEFNVKFPDAQKKLSDPEMLGVSGFRLSRAYDPVFILTVRVDSNTPAIVWDTVRSDAGGATGLYSDSGVFAMQADSTGDSRLVLAGNPIKFDAAAQKLLLPALEGLV